MGFGNPAAERAALEQTYEDRTDVLRPGRDREGNLTRTVYELVYGALPCALSRAGVQSRLSRERSGQNRAENRLDYDAVLFLSRSYGPATGSGYNGRTERPWSWSWWGGLSATPPTRRRRPGKKD